MTESELQGMKKALVNSTPFRASFLDNDSAKQGSNEAFQFPGLQRSCRFSKTEERKQIQSCVLDSKFWHDVTTCIKAAYPLIKVLRLVDSDEIPTIGDCAWGPICL
ncbi:hypothetical protein POTOM_039411 [Populus tomentosa]|uniref:Uncharacterized protein n=1 Tax=Populus tomentosa TaxID=118781 RepID=A0A8X7YUP9_POPTO|nr:hypothetical protein POTOM_039411 [Populus tomentosa]